MGVPEAPRQQSVQLRPAGAGLHRLNTSPVDSRSLPFPWVRVVSSLVECSVWTQKAHVHWVGLAWSALTLDLPCENTIECLPLGAEESGL